MMQSPSDTVPTIVTIGTFDGVHRGHRWLLDQVVDHARGVDGRAFAVTFEPIPISVLRPELYQGRICTATEKLDLIKAADIDKIVVIPFTKDLAAQSPEEFLTQLVADTGMIELWVGNDFALGRNRVGTVDRIAEIGENLGFTTNAVERQSDSSGPISSSRIRLAIRDGNLSEAGRMLGRPFRVNGTVIHGAHLGRQIGFPTANFVPPEGIVPLPDGIFASITFIDNADTPYPSMTYIGSRPTVSGEDRQIETNLFDFEGDLYGRRLSVDIIEKIRDDIHFDGLEPLVAQLQKDEVESRRRLAQFQSAGSLEIESALSS